MVSHFQLPFMPEALVSHVVVHHLSESGLKDQQHCLLPWPNSLLYKMTETRMRSSLFVFCNDAEQKREEAKTRRR